MTLTLERRGRIEATPGRRTLEDTSADAPERTASDGPATEAPAARPRFAWVDVARGFVVVMVVVMHVGIYHYLPMTQGQESNGFWTEVSSVLQVVRMPALLVLSGWLASSRIRSGLASRRTRRSILANAYLYVLWLAGYVAVAVALGATTMAQAPAPSTFLGQLLLPYSTLWFLAALVWYTAGLAALRRVPAPIVLAGLFALGWVTTELFPVGDGLWANIPHLAIYFALGVHARAAIETIGRHALIATTAGIVTAVLTGEVIQTLAGAGLPTYPLTVLQALAGVAAIFGAASLAVRHLGPLTRPMAWLGRRTLPIYTLHYLAVMAVSTVESGPLYRLDRALIGSEFGRWAYPVVATAVIVALAVSVREAARYVGLEWLFTMPSPPRLARPRSALRAAVVALSRRPPAPVAIPAAPAAAAAPAPAARTAHPVAA